MALFQHEITQRNKALTKCLLLALLGVLFAGLTLKMLFRIGLETEKQEVLSALLIVLIPVCSSLASFRASRRSWERFVFLRQDIRWLRNSFEPNNA